MWPCRALLVAALLRHVVGSHPGGGLLTALGGGHALRFPHPGAPSDSEEIQQLGDLGGVYDGDGHQQGAALWRGESGGASSSDPEEQDLGEVSGNDVRSPTADGDYHQRAPDDSLEDLESPAGVRIRHGKSRGRLRAGPEPPSTETSEDQEEEAGGGGGGGAGVDVVTRFLRIVESQHLLGDNCTAGTDLHLGEGVVDRYAQERFRLEAEVAVNRANWLTRLWKYAEPRVLASEYLLHASLFSVVEFDDDIFAAGNCYDQGQYKGYGLFCPYAHRLPEGPILVKDLAVEYKYLGNSSEWFFIARRNAENVIRNHSQFSRGYNTYTHNDSAHTERVADEILSVRYEDGKWSKPYYDCGGGNIWMLTYTVPFFGFRDGQYFFKGTSGIDIDLRRVDIDQCPLPVGSTQLNIFAASDKCKKRTTECVPLPGLGFRRGSYKCVCRRGFYFPSLHASKRYYNGSVIEEEYEKLMLGEDSDYQLAGSYECLQCAEGCETCADDKPCVASLNWVVRTALLVLSCTAICCLPAVALFTWRFGAVKVVRAASPALLRVVVLGAFLLYCTTIVMYPQPNVYTCTLRIWLREIGFCLTYGALMLKTWRISVIFRVRSAKAVRITDADLLKRLGAVVGVCGVLLLVRTLVAPPRVVVGRTADDLKAYLCRTDWWDHAFTTLEVMFLVWGIRLCIVVRKAPSEFNESRFISMAIYNEFLLSVFLNVSMLFLQSPANPDLLFIIFFCHTQLTATPLLGLIFGSKVYVVLRERSRPDSRPAPPRPQAKLLARSQLVSSAGSSAECLQASSAACEDSIQEEFRLLCLRLEALKEKCAREGDPLLARKLSAVHRAATVPGEGLPGDTAPRGADVNLCRTSTCDETCNTARGVKGHAANKSPKRTRVRSMAFLVNLDDKKCFTKEVTV
ncbi:metabotropic glycine receptor-like [Bacillus rossius redtenbacheri]|uniref:metabotropic glycine receptor-like n=1 Tax=Bacillus rossius redtenbacheri TaxID=93214 RepID=UPI002FDE1194